MSFYTLMNTGGVSLTTQLFWIKMDLAWAAVFTFCNTGLSVLSSPHSVSRWCFKSAAFAFSIKKQQNKKKTDLFLQPTAGEDMKILWFSSDSGLIQ